MDYKYYRVYENKKNGYMAVVHGGVVLFYNADGETCAVASTSEYSDKEIILKALENMPKLIKKYK